MNVVDHLMGGDERALALIVGEEEVTYGALGERVARMRGGLATAGVSPGDRVLLWAVNDGWFVASYLAVLGLGAVAVPVNPQSPPAVLAREAAAVGARKLVAGPSAGDGPAGAEVDVLDAAELAQGKPIGVASVEADEPAVLLFTSGTAGMPKPAVLTHGNILAALASLRATAGDRLSGDDVVLGVIPLFHVFGLGAVVNVGLAVGMTLVLDHYRTPGELARVVAATGVTVLFGPPTLWRAVAGAAADGDLDPAQLATVRLAVSGSAKLDPVVHQQLAQLVDLRLEEGYGLTETAAVAASAVGIEAAVGSVGELMPGVEARLVGPDGDDVLIGDPGELWLRGPMISPGYFELDGEEPVITAATDPEGWLHTGDLAVVDDDGRLSIVDRLKDLVIVSGFNVYPGEVEAVLRRHPEVFDAAVVGRPDEATGEAIVAHIVLEPGSTAGVDELSRHCDLELPRYKVPRQFDFLSMLPRGPGGKVRRQDLR